MKTTLREATTLSTTVVRDAGGFAALEGEWDELFGQSPAATPFQSWGWLFSWWEHHGTPGASRYGLRLVAVRDEEDELVGLLPLMLERWPGVPGRLLFAGTGITDYLDVLAKAGWEREVALAGADTLRRMGGWSVADLQEVRPGAAAWELLRAWDGPGMMTRQSACPMLKVGPWDEVLGALSKNCRSTMRRTLKKADRDGVTTEFVEEGDTEAAARRLVALHRERWRGRGITDEHLSERFEDHVASAAGRLSRRGLGGVYEIRRGENLLASSFVLLGRDFVGGYLDGATQEACSRYQISALRMRKELEMAREADAGWLDMLRGEEPYKLKRSSGVVSNHRLLLGRRRSTWAAYAGYHLMRERVRHHASSEKTPRWVRSALGWLKEIG